MINKYFLFNLSVRPGTKRPMDWYGPGLGGWGIAAMRH